jgi:hypothetical protein
MLHKKFVFALLIVESLLLSPIASAKEVSSEIELKQTGESARVPSPECGRGASMTAADLILKAGTAAIDAYIGQPVTSTLLEKMPPGNRDWLKGRLGIHDGKSTCGTVCVAVPAKARVTYSACASETGRDGLGCSSKAGDLDPPAHFGIASFTASTTRSGRVRVICASGKNWSHNRDRWFSVKASY